MSKIKRVLIADDMHDSIIPLLLEEGYEPVYSPKITRGEILSIIHDFEGLIIRSKTDVDKEIIDAAFKLKFVARAGAGMDKVDNDYLKSKNILAINAPEGNKDALAEHTLGLLLSLMHKINASFDQVKEGVWNRSANRGIEIKGKVVGIYGVGNMGMAFAEKLRGLDCEIIGYDKFEKNFSNSFIKQVSLGEFMKRTEMLSLHIPLSNDTKHLFNLSYFEKFEKLKVFINTARGEIVKTKDLISILEESKIWGAALDVLENEKPHLYNEDEKNEFEKLISFPNILITPHVGGWTYESYERISHVIVEKIKELNNQMR